MKRNLIKTDYRGKLTTPTRYSSRLGDKFPSHCTCRTCALLKTRSPFPALSAPRLGEVRLIKNVPFQIAFNGLCGSD